MVANENYESDMDTSTDSLCSVIEFNVGNIVTDLVTLLHSCQPLLILDLHLFSHSGWFSVVV
jgi:hypothetical protein